MSILGGTGVWSLPGTGLTSDSSANLTPRPGLYAVSPAETESWHGQTLD